MYCVIKDQLKVKAGVQRHMAEREIIQGNENGLTELGLHLRK